MEYSQKEVRDQGLELMSLAEYQQKYHPDTTTQALNYKIRNNDIDFMIIGSVRLVVMTNRTLEFKPRVQTGYTKSVK